MPHVQKRPDDRRHGWLPTLVVVRADALCSGRQMKVSISPSLVVMSWVFSIIAVSSRPAGSECVAVHMDGLPSTRSSLLQRVTCTIEHRKSAKVVPA